MGFVSEKFNIKQNFQGRICAYYFCTFFSRS